MATKRKPGRPRKLKSKRGRFPKTATPEIIGNATRRLEALELRKAGHPYRQIGEWLTPPCSAVHAFRLVAEACREQADQIKELIEDVRAIELDRLDEMMVEPLKAAKQGDTRAIEAVLKIMERRAQIMGSDAPKKQEHSGPDGGPIPIAHVRRTIVDGLADTGHPDAALAAPVPGAGKV